MMGGRDLGDRARGQRELREQLTDAGDVGAVLAHLGRRLLGRRLGAGLIGQFAGVVADGIC